MKKIKKLIEYWNEVVSASSKVRKPVAVLISEAVWLRIRTKGRIGLSDYLLYNLYRDNWYPIERKKKFAFARLKYAVQASNIINNDTWDVFARDKLVFFLFCRSVGIPVPETIAFYSQVKRQGGSVEQLHDSKTLNVFLARNAGKSLFVKPIQSFYGRGAHVIRLPKGRSENLTVRTAGEEKDFSLSDYKAYLDEAPAPHNSFIFQNLLTPHESLAEVSGRSLSGIRMGVVKSESGDVQIYAAVLKLNAGENISDNFEHGMSGNLLANIDLGSGTVDRIIAGAGPNMREISVHPTTNSPLIGFRVPNWQEACDVSCRVVALFPKLNLVGVDVALTDDGPTVLEINTPGDFDLLQIASRQGVLENPEFSRRVQSLL